jgi:hypothetical protein
MKPIKKRNLNPLKRKIAFKKKVNPETYINTKYKEYRILSRLILKESITLIKKIKKHPELKNSQFIFLERDATPFHYVFKEILEKEGFRENQVNTILTSKKLIDNYYEISKKDHMIPKEVYLLESLNESKLKEISQRINQRHLSQEILNFEKQKTISRINPEKPLILIDTGNYGSSLKITEIMLKTIFPDLKIYTALINKKSNVPDKTTNFSNNIYFKKSNNIENTPKFVNRLESIEIEKNKLKLKRTTDNKDAKNTIDAEIFSIALKNQILKYLKE